MTAILGISAHYHDAAAAILVDGEVVAAAQEERFTRRKHDPRFPLSAIEYCLREADLVPSDVDRVAFYDKPLLKFDRFLETALDQSPFGLRSFVRNVPEWLHERLRVPDAVRQALSGRRVPIVYPEHHESHAASAFFPSPFEEAAILTIDGVGEWATATVGVGRGNRVELREELRFPHSLGLLYSAFTEYCGFRVNSGEYKLMGLAPYGEPRFLEAITSEIVDLRDDGSFRLDPRFLDLATGRRTTSSRFHDLFGGPPRNTESPVTEREADLAASVQRVAEEIVLRMARHAHRVTSLDSLCLAGGVALNAVANGRLVRESPFRHVWIQPAAGDAGGALGAAWFTWHQLLGKPRTAGPGDRQHGSRLGPSFDEDTIRLELERAGLTFRHVADEETLCSEVAAAIDDGAVVGWFQGRMEFGPRALGARSILADPRRAETRTRLNELVKFREDFRPFAPAVLLEHLNEWFETDGFDESPYMLLVARAAKHRRVERPGGRPGLGRRDEPSSTVPAVTHVDGTARLQTVDVERAPRFHRLLRAFEQRTSTPMLVNTSFNLRGEPVVCTPGDAIRCFERTNLDVLVLERFVVERSPDKPTSPRPQELEPTPHPGSSLIRSPAEPSPAFVRTLFLAAAAVSGLVAWRFGVRGWSVTATGFAVVAAASAVAAVAPALAARRLYDRWRLLTAPIARTLSTVLLTATYVFVVVPVAGLLRLLGHDPLRRRFDPSKSSYWTKRTGERTAKDYSRRY